MFYRLAVLSVSAFVFSALTASAQSTTFTTTTYANNNLWSLNEGINGHVRADLNGDGIEDFINENDNGFNSGCNGQFAITLSKSDGTYGAPTCYTLPSGNALYFAVGDFYDNGLMDLVVATDESMLYMFQNNGTGILQMANSFSLAGVPGGMVAADVNHDGIIDVVYDVPYTDSASGTGPNTLYVLDGDGAGAFTTGPSTTFNMNKEPSGALSIGDFDNDSHVDVMVLGASQVEDEILWGDGTGHFTTGPILGGSTTQYAGYDISSTGTMDLIGAPFGSNPYGTNTYYNYLDIEWGHSDRTFTSQQVMLKSCTVDSAAPVVADFNGDGINDIVVAEGADCKGDGPYTLNVMLGNGDGTFKPEQVIYSTSDWIAEWHVLRASQHSKPDLTVWASELSQGNQISNAEQLVLVNTTSGNFPACTPLNFEATGINICSPVSETGTASPVTFSFGGSNETQGRDMELWIDGKKLNENLKSSYSYYNFLSATVSLSNGEHTVTAYSVGWDYTLHSTTFTLYVGSTTCPVPSSDGLNVCSPIGTYQGHATLTSPVLAQASGNVNGAGSIVRMEVWVDGVKEYSTFGSDTLKTSLTLPAGWHKFDYYIVASDGNQWESTVYDAVQ